MSYLLSPVEPDDEDFFKDVGKKWKERNDRQLRLWGIHGQDKIDSAKVCLLSASSVGAEILKNIVLPGFGEFTIVDDNKVTSRDLGNNFFVSKESIGKSRAAEVTKYLLELNPEVVGYSVEKNPYELVKDEKNHSFFEKFNFIIATNIDYVTLQKLAKLCFEQGKVLIVCRSYGLIGYIRIYGKCHEVIEGKLDQEIVDFRLNNPWKEFKEYLTSFDLSTYKGALSVPYPVLLYQYLEQYKKSHDGNVPKTEEEKSEFKKLIESEHKKVNLAKHTHHETNKWCSKNEKTEPTTLEEKKELESLINEAVLKNPNEENFEEAIKFSFKVYSKQYVPDEVIDIINDERATKLTKESSDFWFMAYGLKKFYEEFKYLPVSGKIPDMESETNNYVHLQKIVKKQSRVEMNYIKKHAQEQLKKLGLDENKIPDLEYKEFSTHAYYLRVFDHGSLDDELNNEKVNMEMINEELQNESSLIIWYFLLRAADNFFVKHKHWPGDDGKQDMTNDVKSFLTELNSLFDHYKINKDNIAHNLNNYAIEMCRYGCGEIHNISSLVGGVAAQELIKLCTKQRVPLCNTWVFSGITGSSQSLKF